MKVIKVDANTRLSSEISPVFVEVLGNQEGITVLLPPANENKGIEIIFKKLDHLNTTKIQGCDGELIDGSDVAYLYNQYNSIGLISNGTGWWVF